MEKLPIVQEMVKNVAAVASDQFADEQTAIDEFVEYDKLRQMDVQEMMGSQEQRRNQLSQRIIGMMSLDEVSAKKLANLGYQAELMEMQAQQNTLQTDAERSGLDKVANDFTGRKKSAAKKKLATTQRRREKIRVQQTADAQLEEGERSYAVTKDYTEQMEQGKNSGVVLRRVCNQMLIGTHEHRHKEYPVPSYEDVVSEPVNIQTDDGVLKGVLHRPMIRPTGKVVVYFSGNNGSTMTQSEGVAKAHLENGASVLCMDYRGFGKSMSTDKQGERVGTQLVEEGMYRDSMAMYKYAKTFLAKNPSDIILHGYSLGGSMASRVAAQVSLDNAHAQNDRKVSEKERLGGLILQSPINSAYNVARVVISTADKFRENKTSWGVNMLGKLLEHSSGRFSTESHMQTVSKYDPNIPVLFLSGSTKINKGNDDETEGDFLSLEHTKVDKLAGMKNSATFVGEHHHTPHRMQFDDVADATKNSGDKLRALHRFGRGTDLTAQGQTQAVPIVGLEQENQRGYRHPERVVRGYIHEQAESHKNILTKATARAEFMDICADNTECVVKEGAAGLAISKQTTTPQQLKNILMESKPYAVCVATMTHIGKRMLADNPPQLDDAELLGNLNKPMEAGVEQNGASNLQNVLASFGKMEEKSFRYFMQNEKIAAMYKEMETELDNNKFFSTQPEMMGQALALLFADLSLKYTLALNPNAQPVKKSDSSVDTTTKMTAFGMLARNKSMMDSLSTGSIRYAADVFKDYVPQEGFSQVNSSITSSIASLIAAELQNKHKEK